jgi:hypothetical protein
MLLDWHRFGSIRHNLELDGLAEINSLMPLSQVTIISQRTSRKLRSRKFSRVGDGRSLNYKAGLEQLDQEADGALRVGLPAEMLSGKVVTG